ncbi:MAG: hypothetical protein ABFS03_10810, partial [Chloroflexota bacterium]
MNIQQLKLSSILIKTTIVHTVSYMVMGMLASIVLSYETFFIEPPLNVYMRPFDHPLIMAGPLFQPIRGLLFGVVFFLLRERFFRKSDGWLVMWITLIVLGVVSTFGAAPGSIEGMIYTTLPFAEHFPGWLEVMTQAFLLSLITFYWVR